MKPVRITDDVFRGLELSNYLLEPKLDGWRSISLTNGKTELWTRQKRRLKTPPNLLEAISRYDIPRGTILDGEIWSQYKRGGWEQIDDGECMITFWDCIRVGGKNLASAPLFERRKILRSLLGGGCDRVRIINTMDATWENLSTIRKEAVQIRNEGGARSGSIHGIVLKRKDSPRRDHPNRSVAHPDWLKIVFF